MRWDEMRWDRETITNFDKYMTIDINSINLNLDFENNTKEQRPTIPLNNHIIIISMSRCSRETIRICFMMPTCFYFMIMSISHARPSRVGVLECVAPLKPIVVSLQSLSHQPPATLMTWWALRLISNWQHKLPLPPINNSDTRSTGETRNFN